MPDSPELTARLREAAARGDAKREARVPQRAPATEPVATTAAAPPSSRRVTLGGPKQTVVVWLTLAFLIYTIGRSPDNVQLPPSKQLAAWGVLAFTLAVFVDMDETSEVGKALTMLLLVSILLVYGDGLIKWVNAKVAPARTGKTTQRVSGGGYES